MRITFVLPGNSKQVPMGGFKIVYEYANNLVALGHIVNIIYAKRQIIRNTVIDKTRRKISFIKNYVTRSYMPNSWFTLDPRINSILVRSLDDEKNIPNADIIIATAWWTSENVANYKLEKGRKFYLIQDYENWDGDEERLIRTWHLPLRKIVIAKWLAEIAEKMNESYAYIPNGLNFSKLGVDMPIETRNHKGIMMLYHKADWKGSKDGLHALSIVREHIPDISVTLFGTPSGADLPHWVNYRRLPSQYELRRLYNNAAIFLSPSWNEGWGLPPSEAMMCGAAVIATDIGGHREYLADGVNGCLVPSRQPEAMAAAVIKLIEDNSRRIELAIAGTEYISQFTWDRATKSLLDSFGS